MGFHILDPLACCGRMDLDFFGLALAVLNRTELFHVAFNRTGPWSEANHGTR